MTESLAAVAFYAGLAALVLGAIRLARASLERRQRRDTVAIAAMSLAATCFVIAVVLFAHGPRGVLPF